jgi:hypothetical protein
MLFNCLLYHPHLACILHVVINNRSLDELLGLVFIHFSGALFVERVNPPIKQLTIADGKLKELLLTIAREVGGYGVANEFFLFRYQFGVHKRIECLLVHPSTIVEHEEFLTEICSSSLAVDGVVSALRKIRNGKFGLKSGKQGVGIDGGEWSVIFIGSLLVRFDSSCRC